MCCRSLGTLLAMEGFGLLAHATQVTLQDSCDDPGSGRTWAAFVETAHVPKRRRGIPSTACHQTTRWKMTWMSQGRWAELRGLPTWVGLTLSAPTLWRPGSLPLGGSAWQQRSSQAQGGHSPGLLGYQSSWREGAVPAKLEGCHFSGLSFISGDPGWRQKTTEEFQG